MHSITADGAMKAILTQAKSLVEIRDPSGVVIGFFAPVALEHAARYAAAAAATDPLAHRSSTKEGPSRTTAEVMDQLRTLEPR